MSDAIQHGAVQGTDDASLRASIEEVAHLQDELVAELVGLGTTMSNAMDALPGFVPCGHAFGVVIEGLAASAGHYEPGYLRDITAAVRARSEHVSDHRGVPQGMPMNVRAGLGSDDKVAAMRAQLLASLQGIAPYAMRAMELGIMSDELDVTLATTLAALGKEELGPKELHEHLGRVSEAARIAMTFAV